MFGRLSAGQAMPAWEQVSSRHDRIRQAAALTAETISVVAAAIFLFLRAVLALVAAVARAAAPGRPRNGANGHRPRPGSGAAGRTRRPGLTADEHRHRPRPPGGLAGPAATPDRPPATLDVTR